MFSIPFLFISLYYKNQYIEINQIHYCSAFGVSSAFPPSFCASFCLFLLTYLSTSPFHMIEIDAYAFSTFCAFSSISFIFVPFLSTSTRIQPTHQHLPTSTIRPFTKLALLEFGLLIYRNLNPQHLRIRLLIFSISFSSSIISSLPLSVSLHPHRRQCPKLHSSVTDLFSSLLLANFYLPPNYIFFAFLGTNPSSSTCRPCPKRQ